MGECCHEKGKARHVQTELCSGKGFTGPLSGIVQLTIFVSRVLNVFKGEKKKC